MSVVRLTNLDDGPVTKYGQTINPGEEVIVESDLVIATSLMEISLALQYLTRYAGNEDTRREKEHAAWDLDRRTKSIVQVQVDRPPFLARLWACLRRKKPRWRLFG